jgi:hypothetical protein
MKRPPEIKTPCPKRWEDMRGDAVTRFCDHCELHVQNLSAMSGRRATAVVMRSRSEHVCVTYTRRSDGSMLTRTDLLRERLTRPFRRTLSWCLAAFVPLAVGACTAEPPRRQLTGTVAPQCQTTHSQKTVSTVQERVIVTGGI